MCLQNCGTGHRDAAIGRVTLSNYDLQQLHVLGPSGSANSVPQGHQRRGGQPPALHHRGTPPQSTIAKANTECPSALEEKLDAVLLAIDNTRASLESKIDMVSSGLGLLHTDHRKLADRVTLVEQTVTTLPPRMDNLDTALKELTADVRMPEKRAKDGEGRSLRNNVRLVGLLEGAVYRNLMCCPIFSPVSERIECRAGIPATDGDTIPSLP
ncbi:hypothetical protein NDU88_005116 [Pleurodeles waltl]|uniref:Uncharacterized protein n=1 Tax=Pleurodeles waltl TaxID=8319 RepID=A0AAV7SKQ8_PLEWA|nr:hypothetical protein NDU88_005116 [Pleurodeles waltl]